mmetsp:Transcript_44830/g.51799  ORF Transcript_44830/g.51799 Transcript_44830/m.51799 type:complete len:233 (+) Transcript_44830:930-1628(+)
MPRNALANDGNRRYVVFNGVNRKDTVADHLLPRRGEGRKHKTRAITQHHASFVRNLECLKVLGFSWSGADDNLLAPNDGIDGRRLSHVRITYHSHDKRLIGIGYSTVSERGQMIQQMFRGQHVVRFVICDYLGNPLVAVTLFFGQRFLWLRWSNRCSFCFLLLFSDRLQLVRIDVLRWGTSKFAALMTGLLFLVLHQLRNSLILICFDVLWLCIIHPVVFVVRGAIFVQLIL